MIRSRRDLRAYLTGAVLLAWCLTLGTLAALAALVMLAAGAIIAPVRIALAALRRLPAPRRRPKGRHRATCASREQDGADEAEAFVAELHAPDPGAPPAPAAALETPPARAAALTQPGPSPAGLGQHLPATDYPRDKGDGVIHVSDTGRLSIVRYEVRSDGRVQRDGDPGDPDASSRHRIYSVAGQPDGRKTGAMPAVTL